MKNNISAWTDVRKQLNAAVEILRQFNDSEKAFLLESNATLKDIADELMSFVNGPKKVIWNTLDPKRIPVRKEKKPRPLTKRQVEKLLSLQSIDSVEADGFGGGFMYAKSGYKFSASDAHCCYFPNYQCALDDAATVIVCDEPGCESCNQTEGG